VENSQLGNVVCAIFASFAKSILQGTIAPVVNPAFSTHAEVQLPFAGIPSHRSICSVFRTAYHGLHQLWEVLLEVAKCEEIPLPCFCRPLLGFQGGTGQTAPQAANLLQGEFDSCQNRPTPLPSRRSNSPQRDYANIDRRVIGRRSRPAGLKNGNPCGWGGVSSLRGDERDDRRHRHSPLEHLRVDGMDRARCPSCQMLRRFVRSTHVGKNRSRGKGIHPDMMTKSGLTGGN